MAKKDTDKVNPIKLTINSTGETYELDFNRDSVIFAEARQFDVDDVSTFTRTKIPELFYLSFRMHHKSLAKTQTDAILEEIGGLTPAMLERLMTLFRQAQYADVVQDEDDFAKNGKATVEM